MIPDPEPREHIHAHYCGSCGEIYQCTCNHPELEDLTCDPCDCEAANRLAA